MLMNRHSHIENLNHINQQRVCLYITVAVSLEMRIQTVLAISEASRMCDQI